MSLTSAAEIVHTMSIGASEIAGVGGFSPHLSRWLVYARKRGLIRIEETEPMFWGKRLERVIAEVFSERMGLAIEWWDQRIYSAERPWQHASPDAFILSRPDGEPIGILEIKTAGLHQAGEWRHGPPEYYIAQLEWQMSVTKLKFAYIVVLIAGQDFRVYRVEHDPVREEVLLEIGETFWREHLMAGVEPPITPSEEARHYLNQRYPREFERLRPATVEEAAWLDEYAAVRRELASCESRKDELEIALKQAIGNAEGLRSPRAKFTWKKTQDRSQINWQQLAEKEVLDGFAEDQKRKLIEQYTEVVHGVRRISFHEEAPR